MPSRRASKAVLQALINFPLLPAGEGKFALFSSASEPSVGRGDRFERLDELRAEAEATVGEGRLSQCNGGSWRMGGPSRLCPRGQLNHFKCVFLSEPDIPPAKEAEEIGTLGIISRLVYKLRKWNEFALGRVTNIYETEAILTLASSPRADHPSGSQGHFSSSSSSMALRARGPGDVADRAGGCKIAPLAISLSESEAMS